MILTVLFVVFMVLAAIGVYWQPAPARPIGATLLWLSVAILGLVVFGAIK
jgi:hypothetical protein